MKSWPKLLGLVLGTALFAASFAWLLLRHGPLAPVGVQLGTIVRADLQPSVFGIGTVEARSTYAVGPVAPGRVLKVMVDHGEEVQAGQVVAEMDPIDLDRRVQAARSASLRSQQALKAAEAQVVEAESRAKLAGSNRDRDLGLLAQQAISRHVLDNSTSDAERAEAALEVARATAAAAQQDLERLKAEYQGIVSVRSSMKLRSPVRGIIVSREAEPGTTLVAGQAVVRLINPAQLWVRTRIDQARAGGIQVGQLAGIVLRSVPGETMPGRVARIELQSDSVTEERIVQVSFDLPPPHLALGELAEVTILLPSKSGVLLVPSAAVAHEGAEAGIWRMVEGHAHFLPVALGNQDYAGVTEVLAGLQEGERVIVHSSAQLEPGARVREQALGTR